MTARPASTSVLRRRPGASDRAAARALEPLSVSAFLDRINEVLRTQVAHVEGEVSDIRSSQGKYLYFDLKDAHAVLHCFAMAFRIRTPIEEGMKVRVWGFPGVYAKYGKFSLTVEVLEPSGEGALRRAFELLRAKLEQEGLFALERKRALPRFPERIVLLTSEDAAAYADVLKVMRARRGGLDILFVPVPVQGEGAAETIARAIDWANEEHADRDALVLVRGGGGLADLHAFNDELVVRALARSRIPTVVGVGHERDVTLADLVADVRASTPSNAAELLTPTADALRRAVDDLARRLVQRVDTKMADRLRAVAQRVFVLRETVAAGVERVSLLARRMEGVGVVLAERVRAGDGSARRATAALVSRLGSAHAAAAERVEALGRLLHGLHPQHVLRRGYSITRGPAGEVLTDARSVGTGDRLSTRLARGTIGSVTEHTHDEGAHQLHEGV